MGSRQIVFVVAGGVALAAPLSFGLGWRLSVKSRANTLRPMLRGRTGGTVFPVRRLTRTEAAGSSENSLDPQLHLHADGIAFQVFKADHWPFEEIAEADAPWAPFTMRLAIRHRSGARLTVDLADRAEARDLLRALPPSVACTRRATNIRDWPV